jgi:hypothetical protein
MAAPMSYRPVVTTQREPTSWFPGPDQRAAESRAAWRRLMATDDADRLVEDVIAWIRERWGEDRPCPYCGGSTWEVGPPFELGRPSGELVSPVVCVGCGNTALVNARQIGKR